MEQFIIDIYLFSNTHVCVCTYVPHTYVLFLDFIVAYAETDFI